MASINFISGLYLVLFTFEGFSPIDVKLSASKTTQKSPAPLMTLASDDHRLLTDTIKAIKILNASFDVF